MDPLTDILHTLRMKGSLYFRTHLTAPWGIAVPAREGVARFHVVIDGSCLLETDGGHQAELRRGDLALVSRGAAHTLQDDKSTRIVPLADVLDDSAYDGSDDLAYGGDGAATTLVCGHFAFDDEVTHPVLDDFPPLLHVNAAQGHHFEWLDQATRALGRETARRPPGWEVVVARASEILFVQVLRSQIASSGTQRAVAAFADEKLSRALQVIHGRPEHPWDLRMLARHAGMSRTAFAVQFRDHLGVTPMAYVTQWRLQKARLALVGSDDNVAAIATRHGYASEAAFSRAFQRQYGKPPARYRREYSAAS